MKVILTPLSNFQQFCQILSNICQLSMNSPNTVTQFSLFFLPKMSSLFPPRTAMLREIEYVQLTSMRACKY